MILTCVTCGNQHNHEAGSCTGCIACYRIFGHHVCDEVCQHAFCIDCNGTKFYTEVNCPRCECSLIIETSTQEIKCPNFCIKPRKYDPANIS